MSVTLTLDDIVEAIRVKRTSIHPADLQKCLQAHGFSRKASGGGTSHEHWHHPCGAVVGLTDARRKSDQSLFDVLEHVRDVLMQAQEWKARVKSEELPAWMTGERQVNDGVNVLLFGQNNRYTLIVDKAYPECMVVMETAALEQGRYMAELQRLHAEVQGYAESLRRLDLEYDITREMQTGTPLLKINGSGITVPLLKTRFESNDVPTLNEEVTGHRYEALVRAESAAMVAHGSDEMQVNRTMAVAAKKKLTGIGCRFDRVDHVMVAVIPHHLAQWFGKRSLSCHVQPSRGAAEQLLTAASSAETAYKRHIGKQLEILQELRAYGCVVDDSQEDTISVKVPDGIRHSFGRDAGGCVDIASLRQLSRQMRRALWQEQAPPDERALRSR